MLITPKDRLAMIVESEPLELDGEAYKGKYDIENRKDIEKWLNANLKGKTYTNLNIGKKISISAKGIGKIAHHASDKVYQKSIFHIPKIIVSMKFLASEPNEHIKKGYDSYEYFITSIKMSGKDYTVLSIVGVEGKNFYYDQAVMEGNIKYLVETFTKAIEKKREGLDSGVQLITSGLSTSTSNASESETASSLPKGKYSRLYKILENVSTDKYSK
jgi:disulfide oxidoreductase YuzD